MNSRNRSYSPSLYSLPPSPPSPLPAHDVYRVFMNNSGMRVSVPIRHFTVMGSSPYNPSCMAWTSSATIFGSSISDAPKLPLLATFGLGQPQFKLIAV
jgi:hypothetical protein